MRYPQSLFDQFREIIEQHSISDKLPALSLSGGVDSYVVMDNFTIQRVIYSSQYGSADIKREIGEHMSDEEIEAGALAINELIKYFKKWISHKGVGGKSKYPDVTAAWTS